MKNKKFSRKKSKKGMTVIVGYVLLITFTIVLGAVTYKILKGFVPHEDVNCPPETSLLIESYNYDCNSKIIYVNILNNGKFDVGGYFIYGSDSPEDEIGNLELANYNLDNRLIISPAVKFGELTDASKNSLGPNEIETEYYNLSKISGQIYLIEIVPIRWQTEDRKMKLVGCKDAKIRKEVECS